MTLGRSFAQARLALEVASDAGLGPGLIVASRSIFLP